MRKGTKNEQCSKINNCSHDPDAFCCYHCLKQNDEDKFFKDNEIFNSIFTS